MSTVVTTLIILVVSVLLATVVTFYAINITTTRVQEENLQITNLHVWCAENGTASAAFMITNTGGRDVVINKITLRGVKAETIYYDIVTEPMDPECQFDREALGYELLEDDESLVLPSGQRMIVYLFDLNHISTSDVGVTVGVVVFTANAQYHKETNIEAAP
ncbi:MAG: hypothetical protein QW161_01135 [Candidatus Bathyarchaeia archaeon]